MSEFLQTAFGIQLAMALIGLISGAFGALWGAWRARPKEAAELDLTTSQAWKDLNSWLEQRVEKQQDEISELAEENTKLRSRIRQLEDHTSDLARLTAQLTELETYMRLMEAERRDLLQGIKALLDQLTSEGLTPIWSPTDDTNSSFYYPPNAGEDP